MPCQVSPPTPKLENTSCPSPYLMVEKEPFNAPMEEICSFEDVQGVFLDDSPLFSDSQDSFYHVSHSDCGSYC